MRFNSIQDYYDWKLQELKKTVNEKDKKIKELENKNKNLEDKLKEVEEMNQSHTETILELMDNIYA